MVRLKEFLIIIPLPSSNDSGFIFTIALVKEILSARSILGVTLGATEKQDKWLVKVL